MNATITRCPGRSQPDQALGRDGCAAAAVALPELDGIRLAILGLHNADGSTVLYGHAWC
jgi:hypothetical protein